MRVKKVKFTIQFNNDEKIFETNKSIKSNEKIKVKTIFLNDDLKTLKIVYSNNKSETFKYKDIENLEYTPMNL
jgi:hypothetical protein